jgi:DNA-directed RNA polymerase subunit RPC12/RpoP
MMAILVNLSAIFFLYPAVFLAVIALTWLVTEWKKRRWDQAGRRVFVCGYCGAPMPEEGAVLKIGCPECGAKQYCEKLKVQE